MSPSVIVPGVAAIPSAIVPGIIPACVPAPIVPRIVEPRVIPAVPSVVVVRTVIPGIVPSEVVIRTIEPGIVPASIIPRAVAPVDGGIIRTVPGVPGRRVPRLVGGPGVPTCVVEINGGGVLRLVEIYLGNLVIGDEQSVDFSSAFHEDRGAFGLGDQQVSLFLLVGCGCQLRRLGVGGIVDSVLIPLGGITSVPRC